MSAREHGPLRLIKGCGQREGEGGEEERKIQTGCGGGDGGGGGDV